MARPADEVPEYNAGYVQDLLARDPRVGELELDVEVTNQTAVITVVREALPDMRVDNRVEVADTKAGPAVERCGDPDRRSR
jgi:hypothetical protein